MTIETTKKTHIDVLRILPSTITTSLDCLRVAKGIQLFPSMKQLNKMAKEQEDKFLKELHEKYSLAEGIIFDIQTYIDIKREEMYLSVRTVKNDGSKPPYESLLFLNQP